MVDSCGDGSNQFATESGGVRWQTFPVAYGIATTNSGVDPTSARNSVIETFEEFDRYVPGDAFTLVNDFNEAKINLDGSSLMDNSDKRGLPLFLLLLRVLPLLQPQ